MSVKLVKFKQKLEDQLRLKMAYEDRAFYKKSWLWLKELNERHYEKQNMLHGIMKVSFKIIRKKKSVL